MSYLNKDINKFRGCNALITRGVVGSSSDKYINPTVLGLDKLTRVNDDQYSDIDTVGVSVNGARKNRQTFDRELVKAAVTAGATIVKDNTHNTNRSFNIGEKELEEYLLSLGASKIEDNNIRSSWRI